MNSYHFYRIVVAVVYTIIQTRRRWRGWYTRTRRNLPSSRSSRGSRMKRAKRTISKTLCVFTLLRHIIRCIILNSDGLTCRLIICILDGRGIVDDQYWKTFECVRVFYPFYSRRNHAWVSAKSLNVMCLYNYSPYVIPLLAEPMNLTRWEELPVPVKNQVCLFGR